MIRSVDFQRLADDTRRSRPIGGTSTPRGSFRHHRRLRPSGDTFPWTKIAFGYQLDPDGDDPDELRIYAGEIDRVAVAQTDVTVANNDYIYVRRTRSNDTMLVTAAASVPSNDTTYAYYRLYRVTVTSGVASIQNIYRFGDIEGELPVRWK